jgi:Lipocalin-like domain
MRQLPWLLAVLGFGLVSSAPGSDEAKRFVGTWTLVSIESDRGAEVRGQRPIGVIYYDAAGNMAAQIMPDRPRSKWSAGESPTPEQAKDAISGYTAYFGTYTVDEKARTVSHHRKGSLTPGAVGVDAVRRYEFASADRLILTPVENPKMRLTWERAR